MGCLSGLPMADYTATAYDTFKDGLRYLRLSSMPAGVRASAIATFLRTHHGGAIAAYPDWWSCVILVKKTCNMEKVIAEFPRSGSFSLATPLSVPSPYFLHQYVFVLCQISDKTELAHIPTVIREGNVIASVRSERVFPTTNHSLLIRGLTTMQQISVSTFQKLLAFRNHQFLVRHIRAVRYVEATGTTLPLEEYMRPFEKRLMDKWFDQEGQLTKVCFAVLLPIGSRGGTCPRPDKRPAPPEGGGTSGSRRRTQSSQNSLERARFHPADVQSQHRTLCRLIFFKLPTHPSARWNLRPVQKTNLTRPGNASW